MSLSIDREASTIAFFQPGSGTPAAPDAQLSMQVIRRNGTVSKFDAGKISVAMTKAFLAVNGGQGAASARVREMVADLTDAPMPELLDLNPALLKGMVPAGYVLHVPKGSGSPLKNGPNSA